MEDFFKKLFSPEGFPARWYCGECTPEHGWVYIGANLMIFAAYLLIPLVLFYVTSRQKNAPFRKIFYLFIAFIWFCSLTHLLDAIIFWYPIYRLNALVLSMTAVVSLLTLFALIRELPQITALRSPRELEQMIAQKTKGLERLNHELTRQKERFEQLVNHNPDAITCVDEQLNYRFVNDTMRSYLPEGGEFRDLNKPVEEALTEWEDENKDVHINYLKEVLQSKQITRYQANYSVSQRHFDITLIPLPNGRELLTVGRDVTETKEQQRRLEAKIEQLKDFSYIVSHNLRGPVGSLNSLLDLYQEQPTAAYLEHIQTLAANLQTTVSELEVLVRLEETEQHLPSVAYHFEEALRHAKTALRQKLEQHQVQLDIQFEVSDIQYPKIYLDSMFFNFISNAIKYRHQKRNPHIRIHTYIKNQFLCIDFLDNGQGIDLDKNKDKLFKLYKTFHGNADARGVGLYMTHRQVVAQGKGERFMWKVYLAKVQRFK